MALMQTSPEVETRLGSKWVAHAQGCWYCLRTYPPYIPNNGAKHLERTDTTMPWTNMTMLQVQARYSQG